MTVTEDIKTKTSFVESDSMVTRIKGRNTIVPSIDIMGRRVILTGSALKTAQIFDEELVEGGPVGDPNVFITALRASGFNADIFTFPQLPSQPATKRLNETLIWDNWAVASTQNFEAWWEKLPQESRKNTRRSAKRGVTVRTVPFDDALVQGIQGIYNETPVRQGKKFWHFGKDLAAVKTENETYLKRSEFIGAFYDEELIGFIKMIYVEQYSILIQILSKEEHHDKRPMNVLLTEAVKVCESKKLSHLVYGKYVYGKKTDSPLTEFKRRNGFIKVEFPRYYVPLSLKGALAIKLGLHLGRDAFVPKAVYDFLLKSRSWMARWTTHREKLPSAEA